MCTLVSETHYDVVGYDMRGGEVCGPLFLEEVLVINYTNCHLV